VEPAEPAGNPLGRSEPWSRQGTRLYQFSANHPVEYSSRPAFSSRADP
jgi:hypothetical protein